MSILALNENAPTLVEKWGEYISAKRPEKQKVVASAMERQYRFIQETARRGNIASVFKADRGIFPSTLTENIVPNDIATFTKQSLAMVDMVFEQIVIDQLVDVRTMDGPTAFVHTMGYQQADQGVYGPNTDFNTGLDPNYADCPGETNESSCNDGAGVDFSLTASTITAECKRLQARYTVQAEQDLESQYGDSLSDRLRNFMATELRREMQGEVIDQLIANTNNTVGWSQTPAGVYASLDPKIHQETLYDAIQTADNDIFKSADGFRGANWIAGDPDGLLFLEQLQAFSITSAGADRTDSVRGDIDAYSNKFGVANHRYDIWKMRFMPANTLLLGVKSDNPQEIGHIHATYIPVSDLGVFRDPRTACVDMGVMTRYANATIRPNLFAVVNITA